MRTSAVMTALLLAACSTGIPAMPESKPDAVGAPPASPPPAPPPNEPGPEEPPVEPVLLHVRHTGAFARKVLAAGNGYVVLYEKPVALREAWGRPSRVLAQVSASGEERVLHAPAEGRELIDVAAHPSGELSVLEASDEGWFLRRLGPASGETKLGESIELRAHDVGRIVADGEDVFGAVRTESHAVVAYRWHWDGHAHVAAARTLVVPAHAITATGIHGGTYDTFGQLEAHYGVFAGVDAAHIGYVGVSHARLESGGMAKAHEKEFGEALPTADPDYLDAWVTRVAPDGGRLGTSVIGTEDDEQLYELRGAASGVYALGRSEHWNSEGTGFDAMAAHVAADGAVTMRRFDVSRGDIAFDAIEEPDGALLVAGASGYAQNPNGASIVEESASFLRRVHPDGRTEAVDVPAGPRHNEARFILRRGDGRVVVAGMTDGPGTHSADGDAARLFANGWLEQLSAYPLAR